jgi:hypothetical protein
VSLDSHTVLAKVFILEGTPFVFAQSPMKYTIFKEQVADRFDIGSQDICIVGSAKLGFSPSPRKYGTEFSAESDVDVVLISDELFDRGSQELFRALDGYGPPLHEVRPFVLGGASPKGKVAPVVKLDDWQRVKEAIRNYIYQNFNPGLLPWGNVLRNDIFEKIGSTAGIFLALEPQVFVSRIRCRIFRNWKAAEAYYSNSLRELKRSFEGESMVEADEDVDLSPRSEAKAGG